MALSLPAPTLRLADLFGKISLGALTRRRDPALAQPNPESTTSERTSAREMVAISPDAIQSHSDLAAVMACYHGRY